MFCHRHVSTSFVWRSALVGASLLLAAPVLSQQSRLTQQDATRFQAKLATITKYAQAPGRNPQPRSTQVTDTEVNSYSEVLRRHPDSSRHRRAHAHSGG